MNVMRIDDRLDHYRSQSPLAVVEESEELNLAKREVWRYLSATKVSFFACLITFLVATSWYDGVRHQLELLFVFVPFFVALMYFDHKHRQSEAGLKELQKAQLKHLPTS